MILDCEQKVSELFKDVSELVKKGECDVEEVCKILKAIKDGRRFIDGRQPRIETNRQLASWEAFYYGVFKVKKDFSRLPIPNYVKDFDRLIVVAEGMTTKRLHEMIESKWPSWDKLFSLDLASSSRKTDNDYAVWVRDTIDADVGLLGKSPKDLEQESIKCITLEERFLYEFKYFSETGRHLDVATYTICASSYLYNNGISSCNYVPTFGWNGDRFYGDWRDASDKFSDNFRARQVVC